MVAFKNPLWIALLYSLSTCVHAVNLNSRAAVESISAASCSPKPKQSVYDYIVVGSGPGGGTLAARLALANFSVLLIDAGGDNGQDLTVQIPLMLSQAAEYVPQTWQFFVNHYANSTEAQRDPKFTWNTTSGALWVGPNPPAGSKPLGILYPRASTIGGSAAHNAMVAHYPHQRDWTAIQQVTGDSTWSPANMRQYWAAFENNQYIAPGTPGASGHGYNGWLNISVTDLNLVPQDQKWLGITNGAASMVGKSFLPSLIPITGSRLNNVISPDLNSNAPGRDNLVDIFQIPLFVNSEPKTRSSPRTFILGTAATKPLEIMLNTLVTRVTFNTASKVPRATGVEYITGCNLYRAHPKSGGAKQTGQGSVTARREVILAGGVYNTPQILKLSGVGPAKELAALKIPLVLDSPGVGTNMQDRYEVTVTANATSNLSILAPCTFMTTPSINGPPEASDPCLQRWLTNSTDRGIYGTDGIAFGVPFRSSVSAPTEPDVFIVGLPTNFPGYFPGFSMLADLNFWSYLVLKAHSRNNAGTVTLKSTDPRDTPNINFNSFAVGGDEDLQAVYEGFQYVRKMFSAITPLNGTFTEVQPGAAVNTTAQIKQFIRDTAWGHHASCTVPIGAANDMNTPLDTNFKVKGVTGLRVVDASVFPKIPSYYVAGAVYMISEKAAKVIVQSAYAGTPAGGLASPN